MCIYELLLRILNSMLYKVFSKPIVMEIIDNAVVDSFFF